MPALFYFELHAAAAAETAMANGDGALIGGNAAMNDAGRGLFVYGSGFTGTASDDLVVVTAGGRWKRAQPANAPIPILGGNVADNVADAGNPVKVGARARGTFAAALSASNNRGDLTVDLLRRLIIQPYAPDGEEVDGTTSAINSTTSTQVIAAPGAGIKLNITTLIVSNEHATVATAVAIQNGSGGTTRMTIPAAAACGGAVVPLPKPLILPAATALFCQCATAGASVKVSAVGFKTI